jgi:hypothetical protein
MELEACCASSIHPTLHDSHTPCQLRLIATSATDVPGYAPKRRTSQNAPTASGLPSTGSSATVPNLNTNPRLFVSDWRNTLDSFFQESDRQEQEQQKTPFERFISDTAVPAFEELREELERRGRRVTLRESASSAVMTVFDGGNEEIMYRLQERTFPDRTLPYAQVRMRERGGLKLVTVETMLRSGAPNYHTEDISREEVIQSVLQHYMSRVKPR